MRPPRHHLLHRLRPEPLVLSTSPSLLERLRSPADSRSWRHFVDLYTPLLDGWLRRHGVTGHDAEDLTQEVLSVVVRELPHFRHDGRPGAFRAWLRAVTVNRLRPFWREQRRGHAPAGDFLHVLDQLADPGSSASRRWDQEHDAHVLKRLLQQVEPEFRASHWQAFHQTALLGHKAADVAAGLGLTVNTVLLARSRVLRRLREEARGLVDG